MVRRSHNRKHQHTGAHRPVYLTAFVVVVAVAALPHAGLPAVVVVALEAATAVVVAFALIRVA